MEKEVQGAHTMKKIHLEKIPNNVKVGDKCGVIEPNITEDCILIEDGVAVGFYLSDIGKYNPKAKSLAIIADKELRSDNVPKQVMNRGPKGSKLDQIRRKKEGTEIVEQYSTILGGVPPKPHMRRNYPSISSVHRVETAKNYIKAMILLGKECEKIISDIMPEQYSKQKELIKQNCPKEYRLTDLFTSSISNYNISVDYHVDRANLVGCVNAIVAKRKNSSGGNTTVPDYDATFASKDNSLLVYPAWRNIHGVTPIVKQEEDGYRNTLVFYPLASFKKYV